MNHLIGAPLPARGKQPKFMQVLFCDPKNRIRNLINWDDQVKPQSTNSILEQIVAKVENLMKRKNSYYNFFNNFVQNYSNYSEKKVVL